MACNYVLLCTVRMGNVDCDMALPELESWDLVQLYCTNIVDQKKFCNYVIS